MSSKKINKHLGMALFHALLADDAMKKKDNDVYLISPNPPMPGLPEVNELQPTEAELAHSRDSRKWKAIAEQRRKEREAQGKPAPRTYQNPKKKSRKERKNA